MGTTMKARRDMPYFSHTAVMFTMAEGVALVRAARKSGAFYMLAENYPFMLFNQEIRRVYQEGTLGQVMFAEGEYNHPADLYNAEYSASLRDDVRHWRNFLPATYYITHSLGPLCYALEACPRDRDAGVHTASG